MFANYHTHTYRCHHACGTEEGYIQKAISEGVRILGFSDHAPYIYPTGYVSEFKMLPEEISEYFSRLTDLKEKYKNKIDIHIGFEAEYYPDLFPKTLELWSSYPTEYLILGQHILYNEYDKPRISAGRRTEEKECLSHYVNRVCEAVKTGRFTYIAHPDLINFVGERNFYRDEMSRLINAAKENDTPLEINILGMREGRSYPREDFFALASELSAPVIIGCDAHAPMHVADREEYDAALKYAKKFGLRVLDTVELKNPIF